ncbi:MAG: YybH family protein [Gemmatimonadales bacterium]
MEVTNRPIRVAVGTWLVLLGSGCAAPAADPTEEIRAALAASADAFNRGDLDGHLAIYVEDATMMTSTGPRPGRDRIKAGFSTRYFGPDGKPYQQLRFDSLAVHAMGSTHAYGTARWSLTGGGRPDLGGWFTLIWEKRPEGWRVLHDHTS